MSMGIDLVREEALKILYDINQKGAYSNISINKYLEGHDLRDIDKAFITDLVYGTVRWKLSIDWVIEQFSSVKLKKISPWILNILRLGAYQLLYTQKVPESAACNESVSLSRKYGHEVSSRYVNAVLRNIARKKTEIKYPDIDSEYPLYLSVRYSHPEWLVREWLERFGNAFTEGLLAANNEQPDFIIRANLLRTTREGLIEELKREGIEASEGRYSDEAVIIKNPAFLFKSNAFSKGLFQVQDESSILAGRILNPKPGDLTIDVCSAPGGKATHLAQIMENKGEVIARDIHPHKIKLINDSAKRLGMDIVHTELYDATRFDENLSGKADCVLVDAPCTGLGIIRKKPDIKWSKEAEDKKEINELQFKILTVASGYLKNGGSLVYSTCTVEREENEGIVERFLEANRDFKPVDITSLIPEKLAKTSASQGYVQLYPNIDKTDGFFIAKLEKRG